MSLIDSGGPFGTSTLPGGGGGGSVSSVSAADVSVIVTPTTGAVTVSRAALTGDVTASAGSNTTTLANTAVTPTTYGDSTHVAQFTVDSKGRITAASNVGISGGGGAAFNIVLKSGNYTANSGETVLCTSGTFAVTSPAATLNNFIYVKNGGTGVITFTPASGTVDNLTTKTITSLEAFLFIADGTNWWVM